MGRGNEFNTADSVTTDGFFTVELVEYCGCCCLRTDDIGPNDLAASGFAVVVKSVEKEPSGGGIVLLKMRMRKEERKKRPSFLPSKYAIAVAWFFK